MPNPIQIVHAEKKHALTMGHFGCLGEVATLNVARGCAGMCVFCYARCYTGAPPAGQLLLYTNLPAVLRRDLDSAKRRTPLPRFVVFSSATDGFLGGQPVMDITRACLDVLFNRRIGVSLSTRGTIPEDVLLRLKRDAARVRVLIPLPSLSEAYTRLWEPGTAAPRARLHVIERLRRAGIMPEIRLDPIIPFVNDGTEELREVVSALVGLGIGHATASFFHLRPGLREQIQLEAPDPYRRLMLGGFSRETVKTYEHLSVRQRIATYQRLQRIGREHGLKITACHCQNPGIPAGQCAVKPREVSGVLQPEQQTLSLNADTPRRNLEDEP